VGWLGLIGLQVDFFGFFWACKWTLKIQSIVLDFFGPF
jgi:hypothetical protein